MNAIQLWCALWNVADVSERDFLFHLACKAFPTALVFAAVACMVDVETDVADESRGVDLSDFCALFVVDDQTDISTDGYSGGAF